MSILQQLLRTDHYTEGVVVQDVEVLYYSMTATGEIERLSIAEGRSQNWAHVPAANGHAIDRTGRHIVMSSVGAVVALDADGRTESVCATQCDGEWMIYPNDLALDPRRGGFFVTDSGYMTMPRDARSPFAGRLYRADSGEKFSTVARNLAYANGIALSADGSTLFVGESITCSIDAYPVDESGALGEPRRIAHTPSDGNPRSVPDGFALSRRGRLFVSSHGAREVLVYDPDGSLVDRLPSGNKTTSHIAFSPDGDTLYVSGGIEDEAGAGAIYAIDLRGRDL